MTLLIQDRVDGGVVRLPGAVSPQLVSPGCQGGQRGVSILSQDDPDLRRKPLKKQVPEDPGLRLAVWAELHQVMQHVRRLLAAEGLR
ncbi:MAG: hypothetical protein ACK56I_14285, partial [bacterium]